MADAFQTHLKFLTYADIVAIDECIGQVAKHRHGEVTIVIKDGKPRFVRPAPSLVLGRGVTIDTGPL